MSTYRNPTPEELESPLFEAIWQAIKGWDLARATPRSYAGADGSDVCHILDAIKPILAKEVANARAEIEELKKRKCMSCITMEEYESISDPPTFPTAPKIGSLE